MAGGTAEDAPRRGRPRSETSRAAILAAARELLAEQDLSTISMDAVAVRAGASKATIYRWWPSKELLALDALFSDWAPLGRTRATPARSQATCSRSCVHGRGSLPQSPTDA